MTLKNLVTYLLTVSLLFVFAFLTISFVDDSTLTIKIFHSLILGYSLTWALYLTYALLKAALRKVEEKQPGIPGLEVKAFSPPALKYLPAIIEDEENQSEEMRNFEFDIISNVVGGWETMVDVIGEETLALAFHTEGCLHEEISELDNLDDIAILEETHPAGKILRSDIIKAQMEVWETALSLGEEGRVSINPYWNQ